MSPAAFGSTVNSLPSCWRTTSSPTRGLSSRSTAARASSRDMPLTSTPPIVAFAGIRSPVMMKPTTYSTPSTATTPIRARRTCRRRGGVAPVVSSVASSVGGSDANQSGSPCSSSIAGSGCDSGSGSADSGSVSGSSRSSRSSSSLSSTTPASGSGASTSSGPESCDSPPPGSLLVVIGHAHDRRRNGPRFEIGVGSARPVRRRRTRRTSSRSPANARWCRSAIGSRAVGRRRPPARPPR